MRKGLVVLALFLGAQCVCVRAESSERSKDVLEMIQAASKALLKDSPSEDEVRGALVRLLDAAILTLPQAERTAEARSNVEAARSELKDRSMLSEEGRQHLASAYRRLNAGKSFQLPEIHTIEEAKAHIKDLLAASIAGLKEGQEEVTSGMLLESVLMVVTPIPR
jgi:hypothetical protein